MTPSRAYRSLLRRYGPQGWWPVTPPSGRRPRYRPGRYGRPTRREAEEVCVGAILTQNTAWTNVEKALESLTRAGALDLRSIAALPPRRLRRLIRSSGFFAQKAVKLKAFARHALARGPIGRWLAGPLPALRKELLSIHGVGPETADSMLLYAGGREALVVDAYTRRIGSRLGWFPASAGYDQVQRHLGERMPRGARVYQEFHALLVELAKRHCRAVPGCAGCPLRPGCRHGGGRT